LQRGQVEVLYVARPFPSVAFGKGSGYARLLTNSVETARYCLNVDS